MTRIVIHAGFHKTGTSSVQTTIQTNRRLLERQARCYLKPDFEALTDHTRAFSLEPSEGMLAKVGRLALRFFETLDAEDTRPILMSSEDLSGVLPGRRGLDRYDAAALIMRQLAAAARVRFGKSVELIFFFSTRARDSWLQSTYWQNLRSTRLTLDRGAYETAVAPAADLTAVLEEVAEAVIPARVSALPLEESTRLPQGPITPLLELVEIAEITRGKLILPPPANVQPDLGLTPVFLALNRSALSDEAVADAKRHLRQSANKEVQSG